MVKRRGDDAFCPETPRAQLIHAHAGRDGVITGAHPVIGCGGDDNTDPARTTHRAAANLTEEMHHGSPLRTTKQNIVCLLFKLMSVKSGDNPNQLIKKSKI